MAASLPAVALGAEVALVGVFPGAAVLVVDGGAPRTVRVGSSIRGVRVVSVERDTATVEVEGRRTQLRMGESPGSLGSGESGGPAAVTLTADGRGHFVTPGSVNGAPIRFLVDTGATYVSIGRSDAARIGVDLKNAEQGMSMTANGPAPVWKVRLSSVSVGAITLRDVDGVVHGTDMPMALLGMSFLNRMEMRRNGESMTLKRRF